MPPSRRRTDPRRLVVATAALLGAVAVTGCGSGSAASPAIRALTREARPIGVGPRFRSRVRGPVPGPCRAPFGVRTAAHVEVFAENRVVLLPIGIGVRRPVTLRAGRIAAARCFGAVVTLDPTGTAWVRAGSRATLGTLFDGWGVSLSRDRLAGFDAPGGSEVRVYRDGRRIDVDPRWVVLTAGAEIVLEVGPDVPPHHAYAFPPAPAPNTR